MGKLVKRPPQLVIIPNFAPFFEQPFIEAFNSSIFQPSMNKNKKQWFLSLVAAMTMATAFGQQEPSPHDFGKMWTFENAPKDWFLKAYNYDLDQEWFDEARNSALRFASWCSASFVSPNGLVMTNHHCSQPVVSDLQKEGENFDKQGFYASTYAEERRNPELFVE